MSYRSVGIDSPTLDYLELVSLMVAVNATFLTTLFNPNTIDTKLQKFTFFLGRNTIAAFKLTQYISC